MVDEKRLTEAERQEAEYFARRMTESGVPRPTADVPAISGEPPTLFHVQEMELNFGPQHPSTHGVLRLVLKVDGEKILEARPEIGYLHRGTEKLFETQTYPM